LTTVDPTIDGNVLLAEARASIKRAYAPYSKFPVAAAVIDDRGRIFTGVNIENASYGLTICAERVAIFSAIAAGARSVAAIAVTSEKLQSITPCGACRQVMAEFCPTDTPVFLGGGKKGFRETTVGALLPDAFLPTDLKPKTPGFEC
jgi:cytidine deaminase